MPPLDELAALLMRTDETTVIICDAYFVYRQACPARQRGHFLEVLLERCPNLALAADATELVRERMPLWNRYAALPVRLG